MMIDIKKSVKKIKILNELLVARGKNKIILKKIGEPKHLTMSFKDGRIDVHETDETKECKEERHISLIRGDIKKLNEIIEKEIRRLVQKIQEIDITNPKWRDYDIIPRIEEEAVLEVAERKGKELIINAEKIEGCLQIARMSNADKLDFKLAYIVKGGKILGTLTLYNKRYFLLMFKDLDESYERLRKLLMRTNNISGGKLQMLSTA